MEGSAGNPISDGGPAARQSKVISLMPSNTASGNQGWMADLASHVRQTGYCML